MDGGLPRGDKPPGGEYWFDLAMTFNPRDMAKVNRVFAELLAPKAGRRHRTVQTKFYLSADTYDEGSSSQSGNRHIRDRTSGSLSVT